MNYVFHNTIIVGAGQAGLAMAYYLNRDKIDFIILEKDAVAQSWINRYDALKLITPNPFNSLPGLTLKSKDTFPTRNEVIQYLKKYSLQFNDKIITNCNVSNIQKQDSLFTLKSDSGRIFQCTNLVIATGYLGNPSIPALSSNLSDEIIQIHSSEYKNSDSFTKECKNIAVVGAANSGLSIAKDLSSKYNVHLFQGNVKRLPRKILGIDIFFWFKRLGVFQISRNSSLGTKMANKLMFKGDTTFGLYPKNFARNYNINLLSRVIECNNTVMKDKNSKEIKVDGVVWATGFKTNYHNFIDLDIFDKNNSVIHDRGITKIQNLYFLGLKWQYNINSFLLFGVGRDAEFIYNYMIKNDALISKQRALYSTN